MIIYDKNASYLQKYFNAFSDVLENHFQEEKKAFLRNLIVKKKE